MLSSLYRTFHRTSQPCIGSSKSLTRSFAMLNGFSISSIDLDTHFLIEEASFQFATSILSCVWRADRSNAVAVKAGVPDVTTSVYKPTVVLSPPGTRLSPSFLQEKATVFKQDFDFLPVFWSHVVIAIPASAEFELQLSPDIHAVLEKLRCNEVSSMTVSSECAIPEGPYYSRNEKLHKCWRLWPDCYEAFQLPVVQLSTSKFVGVTTIHDGKLMVPVPSKLHYRKTQARPLSGLRFTIKDIIDLKGVRTTAQSRAYAKTYDRATATAPTVQRLLDLGAVAVGKTKGTQFASSDQPTVDWVDYHCPWNPRGDGYLSPRGSSTGPSVAVAGYNWIDFGIGTDTGGSIRGPASIMGHLAIRPSITASDMTGIVRIARTLDTTGVVCRNVDVLEKVTVGLYGANSQSEFKKPVRLLYPTDFWKQWPDDAAQEARDSFVRALEQFIGSSTVKEDLADKWLRANPAQNDQPIEEYLRHPFMNLLWKGYHEGLQQFRTDHERQFGHPPYLHPVVRYCYEQGASISPTEVEDALERQRVYGSWLRDDVFSLKGFDTIMVYPVGDDGPFYRDEYRKPPSEGSGYNWFEREDHQASLAGLPALVVPVGHVPYPSKVTGGTQRLPVAVSLMSGQGTDAALATLLKRFMQQNQFPGIYTTGEHAFPSDATTESLWQTKLGSKSDVTLKL